MKKKGNGFIELGPVSECGHKTNGWCHLCRKVVPMLVHIWYKMDDGNKNVRICTGCLDILQKVAPNQEKSYTRLYDEVEG